MVDTFVKQLFSEDFHHKQVTSMALFVLGVLYANRLGVTAIGSGMAKARATSQKHGIKQFDRFLSNKKIRMADFQKCFASTIVNVRKKILVTMDWTDFDADDQTVLVLSLVTRSKRALPLIWTAVKKSTLKGTRNLHEKTAVQMLRQALQDDVHITILADRGFGDTSFFDHLSDIQGVDFVIRFKSNYRLEHNGEADKAAEWVPSNGRIRLLENARLTADVKGPYTVVLYKARGMKDSWCLATSLTTQSGREIVDLYAKRFECEEAFRDLKDQRYGLGLRFTSIANPQRRERLLLIASIAYYFVTLAGVASEKLGIDRIIKANTVRQRTHSLFRQGREVLTGTLPEFFETRFLRLFQRLFNISMEKGFCHALS
jgi:hypothetical protein